jgi:hypothetical protein
MIIIDIIYVENNKIILHVINEVIFYQIVCFFNIISAKVI